MSAARNPFDQLVAPLIASAERFAKTSGERKLRANRGDGLSWRKPALLWPDFSKRTG